MTRRRDDRGGDEKREAGLRAKRVIHMLQTARDPSSAVVRHRERSAEVKLLRVVLWIFWLALCAVLWVLLLDTSYDWISSTSNIKVVFGFVILVSMVGVVVALVIKGARLLWTR
jgi:hypothetical protein